MKEKILCKDSKLAKAVLYLPDIPAVSIAVTTALYAYMILQFCVRMQIVYFDREQIERADLKPYYNVQ